MVTNAIEWEGRRRRRHSDEFRAAVIEKCRRRPPRQTLASITSLKITRPW